MIDTYTSEEDVLSSINHFFPHIAKRQDDATLLPHASYVTSVDIVGENLDFRLHTFTPQQIGYKALAVNISDCMAMGALPRYFLMALGIPENMEKQYFEQVLEEMALLAEQYNLALIGGDIAFEETLRFVITILGIPIAQPIRRGNACVGDVIFYVPSLDRIQPLGLARVGFEALEQGYKGYIHAKQAQQKPALIHPSYLEILATFAKDISLMDCSDGLYLDIPRLLATSRSCLGADILLTHSMLHHEVIDWCSSHHLDPVQFAFHGGEEYCLLGTAPPHVMQRIKNHIPQSMVIGTVVKRSTIICKEHDTSF